MFSGRKIDVPSASQLPSAFKWSKTLRSRSAMKLRLGYSGSKPENSSLSRSLSAATEGGRVAPVLCFLFSEFQPFPIFLLRAGFGWQQNEHGKRHLPGFVRLISLCFIRSSISFWARPAAACSASFSCPLARRSGITKVAAN